MTLVITLMALWIVVLSVLYVRQSQRTRVLRKDTEALVDFANKLTGPR